MPTIDATPLSHLSLEMDGTEQDVIERTEEEETEHGRVQPIAAELLEEVMNKGLCLLIIFMKSESP